MDSGKHARRSSLGTSINTSHKLPFPLYDMDMRLTIFNVLLAAFLLLSACGSPAEERPSPTLVPMRPPELAPTPHPTYTPLPLPTTTPAPTQTPVPARAPTPIVAVSPDSGEDDGAIIAAAINAMQQVESFHAEVDAAFKVVQLEASFRMDEETFGTEFPIRFTGDFQTPDRASGELQVALGIVLLELDIITIGNIAYIGNPETGVWEQYPLYLTGLPDPYDLVLLPSDTSRYSDIEIGKDEMIGGVQTRNVKANLRGNLLGSSYDNLFMELWIGKDDGLIRRLTLAGETTVDERDSAGLAGSAFSAGDTGGKAEFTMTINYTNFNSPVAIEPPIP